MTARILSAALLAITLAGCGGDVRVCGQFDMPGYCKVPPPPAATLTIQNACAYPVTVETSGSALPSPATGGLQLQPGEATTFKLVRDPSRPIAWSGALFAAGQSGAGRAELTLRGNGVDSYAVTRGPALPMNVRPSQVGCSPADAEHPGPQSCRGASDQYVVTFCAQPQQ